MSHEWRIRIVDINLCYSNSSPIGPLKKIKLVLERQGQIEPAIASKSKNYPGKYCISRLADAWNVERLQAAKELGWTTYLITYIE